MRGKATPKTSIYRGFKRLFGNASSCLKEDNIEEKEPKNNK